MPQSPSKPYWCVTLTMQAELALQQTRRQLQPRLASHFSWFDQTGRQGLADISKMRFGAKYDKPVGNSDDLFSIGYSHLILSPPGAAHVPGNSLDLGYLWYPDRDFKINAKMSVEDYETGFFTKPVFMVDTKYRVLDGLQLGLVTHLENVAENSESVVQGIYSYGLGPTLDWHLSQRWEFLANYDISQYSDSNLYQEFNARNIYKFTSAPRELRGMLNYHFENFSQQTIFNPIPSFLPGTVHPYFCASSLRLCEYGPRVATLAESHDSRRG